VVAISLLLMALVFQISAVQTIPKNKIISTASFFGLPIFLSLSLLFQDRISVSFMVPLMLIWFAYPFVAPIILAIVHYKKTKESINFLEYFEYVFFALFIFGFAFKIQHWPLAGISLMVSLFLLIPYLVHLVKTFKSSKGNILSKIQYSFYHVFILTIEFGAVFSLQHYAQSKVILYLPSILIGVFLLLLLHSSFRKNFYQSIQKLRWITSVVLVAFLVLTLHFWARKFDLVPKLYSNEYPHAYEELVDKSNDITAEGIEHKRKANLYIKEYYSFIDELEKENREDQ
jgi:hypothetical protein